MKKVYSAIFSLLLSHLAIAQDLCPSSGPVPGEDCSSTCVSCSVASFSGSTDVFSGGSTPGFCGVLHNDQWFGFVAGTSSGSFVLTPSGCTNGEGLQIAIFADCDGGLIGCNGGTGAPDPLPLPNVPLVIGQTYYLVVDGYNGDICNFTISATPAGVMQAPNIGAVPSIIGTDKICPGGTATYHLPAVVSGATRYTWDGPPGTLINGQPVPVTLSIADGRTVSATIRNSGDIKVSCSNVCRAAVSQTKSVTVVPLQPTRLPKAYGCQGAYRLPWGQLVSKTGIYQNTYQNALGCDSIVEQLVEIIPPIDVTLPAQSICEGDSLVMCGQVFKKPGTYAFHCPSFRGCDSISRFTLRYGTFAQIIGGGALDCFPNGSVPLRSAPSNGTKLWRNAQGQVLSLTDTLRTSVAGWYHLSIPPVPDLKTCRLKDSVFIAEKGPLDLTTSGGVLNCISQTFPLKAISNLSGVQFQWAGNGQTLALVANTVATKPGTYQVTGQVGQCRDTALAVVTQDSQLPLVNVNVGGTINCKTPSVVLTATTSAPNPIFAWTGPNGFTSTLSAPTVSTGGNYTVVVRNQGSTCTKTAVVAVPEDKTLPLASATGGVLSCQTPTVVLKSTTNVANATFAWRGPNGFVSTLANPSVGITGTYHLTVTNPTNGCATTTAATVLGSTGSLFVYATGGTITFSNPSVQLTCYTDAVAPIFAWTGPANYRSSLQNPPARYTGTYTVKVTDQSTGCQATATAEVVYEFPKVNGSSQVATLGTVDDWELVPNPANTSLQVRNKGSQAESGALLTIIDASGRRVLEEQTPITSAWLDVSTLPPGVYQVLIQNSGNRIAKRLVVQR